MAKIHSCLQSWSDKFYLRSVGYDEIDLYSSNHDNLITLGDTLCSSSLIVKVEEVDKIKKNFLEIFEILNVLLLRYIPGQPSAKWCNLHLLLEEYGVYLPQEVQDFLNNKLNFPGHGGPIPVEELSNSINPSTNSKFQPRQKISLRLHKTVTLKELFNVVKRINDFQKPLSKHFKMLVFFKLRKSALFDKYLRHHLKKQSQAQVLPHAMLGSTFLLSQSLLQPPSKGLPVNTLVEALQQTNDLIAKIIEGTATYSEVIIKDRLLLEQMNIKKEFSILSAYSSVGNSQGLNRVKSMLELFQYIPCIKNIKSVCEQYQLQGCLDDQLFKDLIKIMEEKRD